MTALIFSDIHSDLKALRRLAAIRADHYFCAGDLVSWSRGLEACGEILEPLGSRVHVIPGNHESAAQITAFCGRFGLDDFHGKTMQGGGCHIAGLGYSSPTPFDTPGEYTEDQMAERLAPFAGLSPLVMICHAPPFSTPLDQIRPGLHAGSRAVRTFVEQTQPRFLFCGHIHEAEGVAVRLGETQAVNVGKRGYLLEL